MEAAALSALGVIGLAVAVTTMVSRRFSLPAVLVYLVVGAAAGPSALDLVRPDELRPFFETTLEVIVGLIVFEGAFSIDVDYLRRVGSVVRNLLTVGLALTFLAAAALAGGLGVLPWSTALVFGALVTVTGPTVIGPLVRRVHLNEHVRAVLMGEGVLIDPLGAILVVVVLEGVVAGIEPDPIIYVPTRLVGGALIGVAGMGAILGILRLHRDPRDQEMLLLMLGMSVAVYALSARVLPGSQLAAMATMGIGLAWLRVPHTDLVRSFEDDLTQVLLGAIYVLAAATVEIGVVRDLWPRGFLVILVLMFVVRPASAFISARGSDLLWRERLYIGLIGPRGVVAAALAAFAGEALSTDQRGGTLTALVFLTVFVTVAIQSSYAGLLARWLKVRAMLALIAGAGGLSRRVAHQLEADGYEVVLVEPEPRVVERARGEGLRVEAGDATDVRLLDRLGAGDAELAVASSNQDQANLLFSQYVRSVNPDARLYARVGQPGAVEAFQRAGVYVMSELDALASAMNDLIGEPTIFEALARGRGDRMTGEVHIGSGLNGRRVRDLPLPERVLVLLVQRPDGDIVPNGNTVLRRGDRMLLFGRRDLVQTARESLVAIE